MKNSSKLISFILLGTLINFNIETTSIFNRASSYLEPDQRTVLTLTSPRIAEITAPSRIAPSQNPGVRLTKKELAFRATFPAFRHTTHLNLAPNITDQDLKMIGEQCYYLESLNLGNNKNITEQGLAFLTPRFENIINQDGTEAFDQNGNPQKKWVGCPYLTSLNILSNNNIQNLQTIFEACPNLKELTTLSCRSITDNSLIDLPQLPHLKILDISGTQITGVGLAHLAQTCPNLKKLHANGCPITDEKLKELPQLISLETLNIADVKITGEGLAHLARAYPNLKTLDVWNSPITDAELEDLPQLPHLKILCIVGTQISGVGLAHLARAYPNLKTLIASLCRSITDEGLAELHKLPHLEKLNIGNTQITGVGLANLTQKCPNLKELNALNCHSITDEGLAELHKLPHLEILIIRNTQITGVGLAHLAQKCPNLKKLYARECPIAQEDRESIQNLIPQCDILWE